MSSPGSPLAAAGGRRPGRRRLWLLVALALAATTAGLALGPARGAVGETIEARRADLVLTVEVEGELAAVRSVEIGVPPVAEVDFKIAFLAPEGSAVRQGAPVLKLDTETLERQLAEKRAEAAEAEKRIEQKRIDLRLKRIELEQQLAQLRSDLGRARLKTEVPPEVQKRVEYQKALLERQGREREGEALEAERAVLEAVAGAELRSLGEQAERARGRVRALEAAIGQMTVLAPQDGIVVYRGNWRDEKKKVGDSVWFGEVVLALPDLSEMKGEGFVEEAEGAPVAEGQPVTLRLEARPELDIAGKVARVGRTVRQRSFRSPLKGFRVDIALGRTDPGFMRPAMRFRGEIETGRIPGLLLLPRDAVFLRDGRPVVWVQDGFGWREATVTLGRGNRRQVEIVAGLAEGERVSPIDRSAPEPTPAGAPGGIGR